MSNLHSKVSRRVGGSGQLEWLLPTYADLKRELHLKFTSDALLVNNGDRFHELRTVVQESGGSITSGSGHFGNGCGVFTQTRPGSGSASDYNFATFLQGYCPIDFANNEFYFSVWIYLPADPVAQALILSCNNPNRGNNVGPTFGFASSRRAIFTTRGGVGGITTVNGSIPLATWFNLQVSRTKRPGGDDLGQLWVNGVSKGTVTWTPSTALDIASGLNRFYVGADNGNSSYGPAQMVRGFQGSMEDLYLQIGPGTGINAAPGASISVPSEFAARPPVLFAGADRYYRNTHLILNGSALVDQSCCASQQSVVATGGAGIGSDSRFPSGVFLLPGGTNSDFIDVTETNDTSFGGGPSIDPRREGAIEFAFLPISKTSQYPMVLGNYNPYSVGSVPLLGIHFDRDDQPGKLTVALGGGGFPNLSANLSYGSWYDVKVQFNGPTVNLIINNSIVATTTNDRGIGPSTGTPFKVRIGNSIDSPTQSKANFKMAKLRWTRDIKRTDPSDAVLFPTTF